jgi:hypothetical protein
MSDAVRINNTGLIMLVVTACKFCVGIKQEVYASLFWKINILYFIL